MLAYVAFATHDYYWDGVLFSLIVERVQSQLLPASELFHPNHLLYMALGYVARAAAGSVRALALFQGINMVVSALTGVLMFVLCKRVAKHDVPALLGWMLFAFGATWWKFSTDADAYVLAVALVIVATIFGLRDRPLWIGVAAGHVAAMLIHELAVFFYVPALYLLFTKARSRYVACSTYLFNTALAVVAVYWVCYREAIHSDSPTLWQWVTSFSPQVRFAHDIRTVVVANIVSYGKLFAGGKLSLVRQFWSLPIAVGLAAFAACIAFATIAIIRSRSALATGQPDRGVTAFCVAWIAPYALFLTFFEPANAFYKLFIWPPLVLLIVSWAAPYLNNPNLTKAAAALIAALVLWNLSVFMFPHMHDEASPVVAFAKRLQEQVPGNATVYYKDFTPDDWYLAYFAPGRNWIKLTGDALPETSGPVCVETTAMPALRGRETRAQAIVRNWKLVDAKHHVEMECFE